jgi:hypothetical protein
MKHFKILIATVAMLFSMQALAEMPAACATRVEQAFTQMKQAAIDTVPVVDKAEVANIRLEFQESTETVYRMHDKVIVSPLFTGFETVMDTPVKVHHEGASIDIAAGILHATPELCDFDDVYIQGVMGHEFGHLLTAQARPEYRQAMVTWTSLHITYRMIEDMANQYAPKIYRTANLDSAPFLAELQGWCDKGYTLNCQVIANWHEGETY